MDLSKIGELTKKLDFLEEDNDFFNKDFGDQSNNAKEVFEYLKENGKSLKSLTDDMKSAVGKASENVVGKTSGNIGGFLKGEVGNTLGPLFEKKEEAAVGAPIEGMGEITNKFTDIIKEMDGKLDYFKGKNVDSNLMMKVIERLLSAISFFEKFNLDFLKGGFKMPTEISAIADKWTKIKNQI